MKQSVNKNELKTVVGGATVNTHAPDKDEYFRCYCDSQYPGIIVTYGADADAYAYRLKEAETVEAALAKMALLEK